MYNICTSSSSDDDIVLETKKKNSQWQKVYARKNMMLRPSSELDYMYKITVHKISSYFFVIHSFSKTIRPYDRVCTCRDFKIPEHWGPRSLACCSWQWTTVLLSFVLSLLLQHLQRLHSIVLKQWPLILSRSRTTLGWYSKIRKIGNYVMVTEV